MTLHFDLFYEYALFKIAPNQYLAGEIHGSQSKTLLSYLREIYNGDETWRRTHYFHKRNAKKGLESYVKQFFGYHVEGLPEIKISIDTNANDDEDLRAFKSTARAFSVSPFPFIVVGTGNPTQPNVLLLGKDMEDEGVHEFGIGPDDMQIAANTARVQRYVEIKAQQMLDYFFNLPKDHDVLDDLRLLTSVPDPKDDNPKKGLPELIFHSLENSKIEKELSSSANKTEIEKLAKELATVLHERIPEAHMKGPLYNHLVPQYITVRVILNNLNTLHLSSLDSLLAVQKSTVTNSVTNEPPSDLSPDDKTKKSTLEALILSDKPEVHSQVIGSSKEDRRISCANTFTPLLCIRFLRLLQKYNSNNRNPTSAMNVDESQFDEKSVDGLNFEAKEEDANAEPWGDQSNVFFE